MASRRPSYLSKAGVLNYLDKPHVDRTHGMLVFGASIPGRDRAWEYKGLSVTWGARWDCRAESTTRPVPSRRRHGKTTRGYFKPRLWRRNVSGRWLQPRTAADISGRGTFFSISHRAVGSQIRDGDGLRGTLDLDRTLHRQHCRIWRQRPAASHAWRRHLGSTRAETGAIVFAKAAPPPANGSWCGPGERRGGRQIGDRYRPVENFMPSPNWKSSSSMTRKSTFPSLGVTMGQQILILGRGVVRSGNNSPPATDSGRRRRRRNIGGFWRGGKRRPPNALSPRRR